MKIGFICKDATRAVLLTVPVPSLKNWNITTRLNQSANRKRKFVLRVPVTPEERALIQQKMAQLGTKNFSAYARKMLIDGYIVHIDTGPVRAQTAELQKIGVNINQIARRINSTGTVYAQDLEDIKGALAQIWQLQRSILSSQR